MIQRQSAAKGLLLRRKAGQKRWAADSITFKTRNIHRAMLIFALKNGSDYWPGRKRTLSANRIWLRKAL